MSYPKRITQRELPNLRKQAEMPMNKGFPLFRPKSKKGNLRKKRW